MLLKILFNLDLSIFGIALGSVSLIILILAMSGIFSNSVLIANNSRPDLILLLNLGSVSKVLIA